MVDGQQPRGAKSGWTRRRQATRIWSDCPPAERAQEYLRRAMEAERQAASGADASRRELIDRAMQWRDLADLAQQLARAESGPEPWRAPQAPASAQDND